MSQHQPSPQAKDSEFAKLRAVVNYLLLRHPVRDRLTPSHVAALVFLSDWRSAIEYGRQVTGVQWRLLDLPAFAGAESDWFDEDAESFAVPAGQLRWPGEDPNLTKPEVLEALRQLPSFLMPSADALNEEERMVLDFVIAATSDQSLQDLTQLVRSTYPAITQPPQAPLDLVRLADSYRIDREMFIAR